MTGERQTWEYRSLAAADASPGPELDLDLDALGRDGWELIAALPVDGTPTFYFKRPGPHFRERVTLDQKRALYARLGLALPDAEGPQA